MPQSTQDDLIVLLADERRRQVLAALLDEPAEPVPLTACLDPDDPSAASVEELERHLDALERAAVVDYDSASGTVARGDQYDRIEPLVRSITERDGGSDRVERQRDELELVARALRHDLVNSLNTVRARTAMLEPEDDPDAQAHYDVVRDRVESMLTRVETMAGLMTAISDSGTTDLSARNLRDALADGVETLRARHDGVDVHWEGAPDVAVRADERLPLVLDNVLRNAVEHNDQSSPTIAASAHRDDGRVTVIVEDDGPGIPAKQREAVFEEGTMGAESEGTGFGLHFVKRTVDDYGGEVEVEDRSPRGTRVRISLPRATDA